MIVYGMTWSLAVFGRDEILRPLANIAFLLGISVFALPAAMVSAVLISVIFFVVCRWKFETGRWWDTILLIYTPAVFAALALYGLHWLGVHAVYSPETSALLPGHYTFLPSELPRIVRQIYDSFGFFAAVLLLRLIKREAGRADIGLGPHHRTAHAGGGFPNYHRGGASRYSSDFVGGQRSVAGIVRA